MTNQVLPISGLIITLNEEKNIVRCLNSLTWLDEIIMVDSGSTDETITLASKFKNVKIHHTKWLGYSGTKQFGLQFTSNKWIFWVDADEVVTEELHLEIMEYFKSVSENIFALSLPRKTFFMGEWVRYCGWYPGTVVRIFDKTKCTFNDKALHEGVEVESSKVYNLNSDMLHYSYTSVYQYFDKMNAYGKDGALALIQRKKKFSPLMMLVGPFATFFKFYFMKKGYLDGTKGLVISIGSSFSTFIKYVNLYYLTKKS
ncbi:MAG: glycosyltransferase family 2 protein [Bacteroidota bacterium]|nr:glycosyltransferase family 2 protein [Bacteroidota bacterium]